MVQIIFKWKSQMGKWGLKIVNRNEYIMVSLVHKGHQYYKSFGAVFIIY